MENNKDTYVLEMKGVVKEFPGVRALDKVDLKVRVGSVHVICGENGAGKSTLMKVINGSIMANEGEMYFRGEKIGKHTIEDAMKMGIAMIHQELNPVTEMTIAENIYLGREPQKKLFVDFKKMYEDTQKLLIDLKIPYHAKQKMKELSIAGHQLVEIAKAISMEAELIIMDEPSSAIADAEIEILFNQIFDLKKKGVAILYITHKMNEIFRIADDITIIRDGQWVDNGPAKEFNPSKLISLMVGREIKSVFPKELDVPIGDIILEVKNLTQGKQHGGRFKDISFTLRKGEILGFAGLVGAGRSELMRAIFGMDPFTSGSVLIDGEKVKIKHTHDAIKKKIAMVSEDRKTYGLVIERDVRENISLANLKRYTVAGIVDDKAIDVEANEMVELLNIKITDLKTSVKALSGGNQQKVVIAKWLVGDVDIMILDEPTRGIDVGAKSEIHKLMCRFVREGMAIIMISSELPEILGMSDRVVVMQQGVIKGILNREELTQESVMTLATHNIQI